MVASELSKRGINADVLTRGSDLFLLQHFRTWYEFASWKKILAEPPDVLIIHRSSSYTTYEMLKKLRKNSSCTSIFDYDDALFHTRLPGRISYTHLSGMMMTCDAVTAGSHYLKEYACRLNSKTHLLPTGVDTELFHPKNKGRDRHQTTIGWLGSGDSYQLRYLKILKRPLDLISRRYDIKLRIISGFSQAVKSEFRNREYEVDFGFDRWVPIQEAAEATNEFDIGVMPLTDSPWERGKCSMKALEYMACGLPVVASPVGENNFVITNGFNGFLASSESEWVDYLERLISDKELMTKMGASGRKFVEETYSLPVITQNLIDIIKGLQ
jgi:glycosyltransferase involved in cell wall biosynthesis